MPLWAWKSKRWGNLQRQIQGYGCSVASSYCSVFVLWVHWQPLSRSAIPSWKCFGPNGGFSQGPVHSLTKPRSMCSKGSKILSWFQKGMSRFLSWFQLNTWMIFSKLVDFAYNIDVHNFLGGFASEFVKLVSTEHIDGQKILSWF